MALFAKLQTLHTSQQQLKQTRTRVRHELLNTTVHATQPRQLTIKLTLFHTHPRHCINGYFDTNTGNQNKPATTSVYFSVFEHISSTNINSSLHVKGTAAVEISDTRGTARRGPPRCNWTRPRQRLVSPDGAVRHVSTPHSNSQTSADKRAHQLAFTARCIPLREAE